LLSLIEGGPLLVEGVVVALDIAEVASGALHVLPTRSFRFQQGRDVGESTADLSAEITLVQRFPVGSDGPRARGNWGLAGYRCPRNS
jgi:hypothetical protein